MVKLIKSCAKLSLSVKIATALFSVSHSLVIAFERSSDTASTCENFTAMVMCRIVDEENNSMDLCNVIQSCSDKLQWLPHAIPVQLHVRRTARREEQQGETQSYTSRQFYPISVDSTLFLIPAHCSLLGLPGNAERARFTL